MQTEKRLIDVNAIPESATTLSTDGRLYIAWSEIIKAPTVDAVEVVRCKDCKYQHDYDCPLSDCCKESTDFCSYGERRTTND